MTTLDIQEYEFYFGFKGRRWAGKNIRPWHLRHVVDFGVSISSNSVEIGLPTKPPEEAQIFDVSGPVREFNISGVRFDYEEEVSNMDFMFERVSPTYRWYGPNDEQGTPNSISMGLSSMFGIVQASIPGFYLGVFSKIDAGNISGMEEDDLIETGTYNVAFSSLSMNYLERPGGISYDLKFTERQKMGHFDFTKIFSG